MENLEQLRSEFEKQFTPQLAGTEAQKRAYKTQCWEKFLEQNKDK